MLPCSRWPNSSFYRHKRSYCKSKKVQNWVILDGGYIFISTVAVLPKMGQVCCITVWIALFEINLFVVCWSFWYRRACVTEYVFCFYWISFRSDFFEQKKRFVILLFVNFCLLLFLTLNIVTIYPNERSDVFFSKLVEQVNNHSIEEIGYLGGPFFVSLLAVKLFLKVRNW